MRYCSSFKTGIVCSRQTVYEHEQRVTQTVQEACAPGPSRAELLSELAQLKARLENVALTNELPFEGSAVDDDRDRPSGVK
jgi:hypothetical protein